MTLSNNEQALLKIINEEFPAGELRRKDVLAVAKRNKIDIIHARALLGEMTKIRHGLYNFENVMNATIHSISDGAVSNSDSPLSPEVIPPAPVVADMEDILIPAKNPNYVRWGHAKDVEKIIKSGKFYPIWISGLSGNGKTFMVEQACAKLGREMLRVQVSEDTDEDALIGGFRLVNGETVFAEGPVVRAMKRGSVLLIDEIDRPERPLMCLQGVLEGKPILIKKTGEVVHPAPGFTIVATANTLGRGSDDGKFISARILDEALLERFILTLNQPYPTAAVEKRIIVKHMETFDAVDEEFAGKLVLWSEAIRKTFEDDGIDDVITTRRLCHIAQTFSVFDDRMKSIELCVSRFDDETKASFLDLYSKIDPPKTSDDEDLKKEWNEKTMSWEVVNDFVRAVEDATSMPLYNQPAANGTYAISDTAANGYSFGMPQVTNYDPDARPIENNSAEITDKDDIPF